MHPFDPPLTPQQGVVARFQPTRLQVAALLTSVLLLLTACLGGRESALTRGDTARLAGVAVLVCDQTCADQAQCGEAAGGGQVVLLNEQSPATLTHTLAVPVDTSVQIQSVQAMPAVQLSTGAGLDVLFYQVFVAERQQSGWVAGWCIQGTPETTPAPQ
ncbi:MAG: hypothetical protein Fur0021_36290 [Candidatus Promineifilaceae bacterium]